MLDHSGSSIELSEQGSVDELSIMVDQVGLHRCALPPACTGV